MQRTRMQGQYRAAWFRSSDRTPARHPQPDIQTHRQMNNIRTRVQTHTQSNTPQANKEETQTERNAMQTQQQQQPHLMEVEHDMCAVRDLQPPRKVNALAGEIVQLLDQSRDVNNNAVAKHTRRLLTQHSF